MFSLGLCYHFGRCVEENPEQAVHWYTEAALKGMSMAQNNLGICYQEGYGVGKDLMKAAEWFTKAARQGDKEAQTNLNKLKLSQEYFNLRYTNYTPRHKGSSDSDCPF